MRRSVPGCLNLLRPPGEGLLSVTTGSGLAHQLLGKYVPRTERWPDRVQDILKSSTSSLLLGVPSDSGGGIKRGAAHGPLHIRSALYAKHPAWAKCDIGDIPCIPQLLDDASTHPDIKRSCGQALWGRHYQKNHPVSPLDLLESVLVQIQQTAPGRPVLTLGGDHSISLGVFRALHRLKTLEHTAILHIDAHTDLLDERFGIPVCFATWAAHALRLHPQPELWTQLGIHRSSRSASYWKNKFGLQQWWSRELIDTAARDIAKKLLRRWTRKGARRWYLTLDIDGTDARYVPSTGTAEPTGLRPGWICSLLGQLVKELPLIGADITEVAPVLGSQQDRDKTLRSSLRYIETLGML